MLYLVIIVETYECETRVFLAWVIVAAPSCHSAGGGLPRYEAFADAKIAVRGYSHEESVS
jgi:hypothetical protein